MDPGRFYLLIRRNAIVKVDDQARSPPARRAPNAASSASGTLVVRQAFVGEGFYTETGSPADWGTVMAWAWSALAA
jgi:hypothetical protein